MVALLVAVLVGGLDRPAQAAPGDPPRGRIAVVMVPGLQWGDLVAMPHLAGLAGRSSAGVLSVRAETSTTRCGDGLLELSSMTRVRGGQPSCTLDTSTLTALRDRYRHGRYGARVGLLGDLLAGRAAVTDDAAAVAFADGIGQVRRVSTLADGFRTGAAVVAAVDADLYATADRRAAAAAVDRRLAQQLSGLPADAAVMVLGMSDGRTGGAHLHPLLVAGPGWPHRELTSPTTGRGPYVQLFDIGPTLLSMTTQAQVPSAASGRAVELTSHPVRTASAYVDMDRHARRALSVGHPTFSAFCGVLLGALLLAALGRREAAWVARLVVAAPLACWLVQLLPWWRWPLTAYVVFVVAVALVGVVTWRAVPLVTALVLFGDQLVGAPLQLAAPFGDNPLVAGRFHGMGNIAFGVAIGALLVTTVQIRRTGVVAAVLVAAVLVDGAPMLGDDVGGLLAGAVTVAVVLAVRSRVRITAGRALLAVGGAVALAVAAGLVDYARPADRQTHAGRFVGQVLHGGAARVLDRKVHAVVASLSTPLVTALVVVCVVALVALAWRRTGERVGIPLKAAAAGAAVAGLAGTLLNDSGLFVAAAVALGCVPAGLLAAQADNRPL